MRLTSVHSPLGALSWTCAPTGERGQVSQPAAAPPATGRGEAGAQDQGGREAGRQGGREAGRQGGRAARQRSGRAAGRQGAGAAHALLRCSMGRSSKRCPCSQVPCHAHGTRGEDAVGTRAAPPARTHTHARTRTRVRARRRLPPRCSGPRCSRRRRAATGRWAQDPASASPGTPVRRADSLARDGELDARLGHHVDHRCAPAPPPASGSSPSLTKPSLE